MIYKAGKKYVLSLRSDKNSAIKEFNLINAELKGYEKELENTDIFVGGKLLLAEKKELEGYFSLADNKGKKKVFIMSDYNSLIDCAWLHEQCDLVLHQVPTGKMPGINVKNAYSYVPELFFNDENKIKTKSNIILFGGNDLRREDLFKKYIFDSNGDINDNFLVLHKDYATMKDNRIAHDDYLKLLSLCKYSLIMVREECREIGWVTSRIVESFDNYTLPFVDRNYDKFDHFNTRKVDSYEEIKCLMKHDYYNLQRSQDMIQLNRENIKSNRNKFKEMILNV